MIRKLPRWVLAGGALLAFVAGIVNATGFLGVQHQGITHLTGTTTLLGIAMGEGDLAHTLHFAALIGAFVAGCMASGMIVQDATLKLGRRYGVVLTMEAALLAVAVPLLGAGDVTGEYLASAACGLQNAMASTYSGAVLRTTHFSGTLTDLGIFLGHWLRGVPVDPRRVRLLSSLVLSFLVGAFVGARLFHAFSYAALYVPAAMTGVVGVGYTIYRQFGLKNA
ncbi:YoaK family protein [Dokdonella sp.]|uniref:YoaK family protein n=1 Tax=Dokdonella sp. TaxID=2291710 RepID=UPI002635BCDC|nr:YoaK family protein [Dokdonella sp.]